MWRRGNILCVCVFFLSNFWCMSVLFSWILHWILTLALVLSRSNVFVCPSVCSSVRTTKYVCGITRKFFSNLSGTCLEYFCVNISDRFDDGRRSSHNYPKSDFGIFLIAEVICLVRPLKFDTVAPFTGLLNISDVFLFFVCFVLFNFHICNFDEFV